MLQNATPNNEITEVTRRLAQTQQFNYDCADKPTCNMIDAVAKNVEHQQKRL
jgi:hypothetical protein